MIPKSTKTNPKYKAHLLSFCIILKKNSADEVEILKNIGGAIFYLRRSLLVLTQLMLNPTEYVNRMEKN